MGSTKNQNNLMEISVFSDGTFRAVHEQTPRRGFVPVGSPILIEISSSSREGIKQEIRQLAWHLRQGESANAYCTGGIRNQAGSASHYKICAVQYYYVSEER